MRMERVYAEQARMAASKRFGMYKKEEKKKIRKADVKEDEALELLKRAWKECDLRSQQSAEKAEKVLKGLVFPAADVERFAIALSEFQEEEGFHDKAGYFLSHLINNGEGSDYVIFLRHLNEKIIGIGSRNTKNVIVDGDILYGVGEKMKGGENRIKGSSGDNVGSDMEGGRLIIEKDVEWGCDGVAGKMQGGEIIVKGNVKGAVGNGMSGGRIILHGIVDLNDGAGHGSLDSDTIGSDMSGGEIHIMGDILGEVDWNGIIHGKIYHKGKLIVDK